LTLLGFLAAIGSIFAFYFGIPTLHTLLNSILYGPVVSVSPGAQLIQPNSPVLSTSNRPTEEAKSNMNGTVPESSTPSSGSRPQAAPVTNPGGVNKITAVPDQTNPSTNNSTQSNLTSKPSETETLQPNESSTSANNSLAWKTPGYSSRVSFSNTVIVNSGMQNSVPRAHSNGVQNPTINHGVRQITSPLRQNKLRASVNNVSLNHPSFAYKGENKIALRGITVVSLSRTTPYQVARFRTISGNRSYGISRGIPIRSGRFHR
jgi:hypothetical protein